MNNELTGFIRRNKKFLTIENGQTVKLIFEGVKIAVDPRQPDKEVVFYFVRIDGQNEILTWKTSSIKVAEIIADFEKGQSFTVTREGMGTETKYKITTSNLPF